MTAPAVLVVNAGSSSMKLSLVGAGGTATAACDIDPWDGSADAPAFRAFLRRLAERPPAAVGHRVVHGGADLTGARRVDGRVLAQIAALTPLAPLHQPRALAGITAAIAELPGIPQVACFDTAFHATLPPQALTYPLPAGWRERFGLRKFGFHGLSHAYAARRAGELIGGADPGTLRVVTCHLGAGSSLCAVHGGKSVETTMGFTPLDGLVMATRCGSIDPGLVLWLAREGKVPLGELADALEHRSGLAGLAGLPDGSGDIRAVTAAANRGEQAALLALAVHAHRLVGQVASMAAAMNGMDALVFTGGIGEHAPAVRARAAEGLAFLGVRVDQARNAAASSDADISADGARVRTLVLTAREDLEVARQVRDELAGPGHVSTGHVSTGHVSGGPTSAGRPAPTRSPSGPSGGGRAAT